MPRKSPRKTRKTISRASHANLMKLDRKKLEKKAAHCYGTSTMKKNELVRVIRGKKACRHFKRSPRRSKGKKAKMQKANKVASPKKAEPQGAGYSMINPLYYVYG